MASTTTLGFKVTDSLKAKANKILKKIQKDRGIRKVDALEFVLDAYDIQTSKGEFETDDYIPPSVMDALREIACEYLQYAEETFLCLENFHKSKKKHMLGIEPRGLIIDCKSCKQGKADIVKNQIAKERRKESIKKLLKFAQTFSIITERGFMAQSYICIHNALEGNFIFSRDNSSILCGLEDGEITSIDESCLTKLNPKTGLAPCQYMITLDHLVKLSKEDLETMNLIIPKLDETPLDETPIDDIEKQPESVIVKNDQEVIEVEGKEIIPDICPTCSPEIELSEDDKGKYCHECGYRKEE